MGSYPTRSTEYNCGMYSCHTCGFETSNPSKMGGHVSSHVRRKEIQKRSYTLAHKCEKCGKDYESGQKLGGHKRYCGRSFDSLKTAGAQRRAIVESMGHRCQICGLTEWCGQPIPLELDHIDGNPENILRDNLRAICPNCHAQTPTYKGRNIGKVTNSRRQTTLKKYYRKYR